jgi:hypothetical protein
VLAFYAASLVSVSAGAAATPGVVLAHCTGGYQQTSVAGQRDIGYISDGVKGSIQWTNPNVCSDGSGHGVSLIKGIGWVQVGWWKLAGGSVRGYCERQHPNDWYEHFRKSWAVTAETHVYEMTFEDVQDQWWCRLDGAPIQTFSAAKVGFTSSDGLIDAFGETHAYHGQIGKMSPDKLTLSGLKYRRKSNGLWYNMSLIGYGTPPAPYGRSIPTVESLKVWTNAH